MWELTYDCASLKDLGMSRLHGHGEMTEPAKTVTVEFGSTVLCNVTALSLSDTNVHCFILTAS